MAHATRHGFSLLELLVALTLAGILSGFALVSFPAWLAHQRADAVLSGMRGAINIARHTALFKNLDVVVCPRQAEQCGPRNSWHRGILVFEDHDRDRRMSGADVIVAQMPAIKTGRIVWRAFRNRSYLLFTGRGMTDWQNGHLLYCPHDGEPSQARQLVLNYAGRTYASADRDGDGVHEDAHGAALACEWLRA